MKHMGLLLHTWIETSTHVVETCEFTTAKESKNYHVASEPAEKLSTQKTVLNTSFSKTCNSIETKKISNISQISASHTLPHTAVLNIVTLEKLDWELLPNSPI